LKSWLVRSSLSPPERAEALKLLLRKHGEFVSPAALHPALPDPLDEKFLACAQAASADIIVTGNKRDFPRERCGGIDVISAGELLDRLTSEFYPAE